MTFRFTSKAERDYNDLPGSLQARVDKQLALLLQNLRHPSLQAKKYDEARHIWQGWPVPSPATSAMAYEWCSCIGRNVE